MKNLIRPASLLLLVLTFFFFAIIGTLGATWLGLGKDQGLAGGAIVLFNGLFVAVIAMILAGILAYHGFHKRIVQLNYFLLMGNIVLVLLLTYRYQMKQRDQPDDIPMPPKTEAQEKLKFAPVGYVEEEESDPGLGVFAPTLEDGLTLYFFNNPLYSQVTGWTEVLDSIAFGLDGHGNLQITTAPPWLMPLHLKLDYGVLYFTVLSVGRDLIEIEVNTFNHQRSFVSRSAGKLLYWPDFYLTVHSVEWKEGEQGNLFLKPLTNAATVHTVYEFMRPLQIKDRWMMVELQDKDFNPLDKAWIRWKEKDRVLIQYSLFS